MVDKAIDLVKWVDTPFKLFEVIILACVFFFGYFAWDSRQVILTSITNNTHKSALREVPALEKIAQSVMKDLEAETIVVHKANLVINNRTTLVAYGPKGRETAFDGYNSTLFNKDPVRNAAMIAMMNGEVYCSKQEVTGKTSDWERAYGVNFVCWASIPPEIGEFEGYISVGFSKEPSDLSVVKTRMNLASTEMAK
jgi:predicted negative regulator of RcsB-dependent stress response